MFNDVYGVSSYNSAYNSALLTSLYVGNPLHALFEYSSHPFFLVLAIIVVSWIWEDAALVSGALFASDQQLSVHAALIAIFVGITSGDLALYYVGSLAKKWRRLRGAIYANPKARNMRSRFRQKTLSNIMIIRFIPGLRTIGFTLCGLWGVPILKFLWAMSLAGVVWLSLIFSVVYQLGASEWLAASPWKWGLFMIAFMLLLANNLVSRRLT